MRRITRSIVESRLESFNTMLGLPTEYSIKNADGTFTNQIGNIHLNQQNGTNNIYQLDNAGGGCKGLAYGLTLREALDWINAAMVGIQLSKGVDVSR